MPGKKKKTLNAKQTTLHVAVPSRQKVDSAACSNLSSACHSLFLTISRASGQKNIRI